MSGDAQRESSAATGSVTIVTQTRVRPESADAFARWQDETSGVVAAFPGFIKQTVMPPSPPAQVDWVILQRFAERRGGDRLAQLGAAARRASQGAAPMLVGRDDVHLVNDGGAGVLPAPVSAVISTRIKPGQEAAYRAWEQRIAAAQSKAPGFQGYRFEPPVPGVQEDWLAILRFDTEANLQAWLDSPERQQAAARRRKPSPRNSTPASPAPASTNGSSAGAAARRRRRPGSRTCSFCCCSTRWSSCSGCFVQTPLLIGRAGPAVRGRAVHRQRRQRHPAELSRALDEHRLFLVAAAGCRAPTADRDRRNRAGGRALRADGVRVLAIDIAVAGGSTARAEAGASTAGRRPAQTKKKSRELGGGRRKKHAFFPSSSVAIICAMRRS